VVTMKIRLIVCTFFLVSLSSCFLFLGSLSRSKLNVVLIKDNPKYIGKDRDQRPIGNLGTLPMHKGATLFTIGRYGGGINKTIFSFPIMVKRCISTEMMYLHRMTCCNKGSEVNLKSAIQKTRMLGSERRGISISILIRKLKLQRKIY